MKQNNTSPFCSREPYPEIDFTEREIIHYMEVERVSKDYNPEKPHEFLIEKTYEEYERLPIDDYIDSFSSKVGLKNELKGIVSQAQMDEYISLHKAQPGFIDLTKLPDTALSMGEYAVKIDKIWSEIPDELKKGLSKEEFLKTITYKQIDEYVKSKFNDQEKENE